MTNESAAYSKNVLVRAAGDIASDNTLYGHMSGPLAYERAALGLSATGYMAFKLRALASMIENTDAPKEGLQLIAKTVGQMDVLMSNVPSTESDEPFPAVVSRPISDLARGGVLGAGERFPRILGKDEPHQKAAEENKSA